MSEPSESTQSKTPPKKEKKRGRFLSFGLKTLLLLFCLSAIGINYWRKSVVQKESLEILQSCGAEFVYEHEMGEDFDYLVDPWERIEVEPGWRDRLRYFLGSSVVDRVACVRMIEKSNFAPIRPLGGKRKYHQADAWIALRKLNELNSLKAVAAELNSKEQIEILSQFYELKYLQVISYSKDSLEPLSSLPNLEALEVATRTSEVSWIADCSKVTKLHLRRVLSAPRLTIDLSFLSRMPQLEQLEFRAVELRKLDVVNSLTNLNELGLVHTDVQSIDPFAKLKIEELRLTDSAVTDANAILNMPSLKRVDLRRTLLTDTEVAELKRKLTASGLEVEVTGTGTVPETELLRH